MKVAGDAPGLDKQADREFDSDYKSRDRPRLGLPQDADELRKPLLFIGVCRGRR